MMVSVYRYKKMAGEVLTDERLKNLVIVFIFLGDNIVFLLKDKARNF